MMSSDIHLEQIPDPPQEGSYKALADLKAMAGRPTVQAWINAGDMTSRASEGEYAAFHDWMSSFPAGKPVAMVPGNHDLIGTGVAGGVPDIVTPAQWAARMAPYGVTGRNYVVDVGDDVRILCLSPMDNLTTGIVNTWRLTVDAAILRWCDARLDETDRKAVILFHAPLYGTMGTPDVTAYNSYAPGWHVHSQDSYTVEQMLAKHPNVVAWVSGHNHAPPHAPDVVKSVNYGAGPLAAVSIGSPLVLPHGTVPAITGSMLSVFDDRVEVRYRDHGAGQWLHPTYRVALGV